MHIPGYRIIRKINHGGMSTVYLAIQESVGRVVALKVMSPALNGDPTFSERFQREANIVGQLSHPNIVSIYDIGRHNSLNYIAMDYLPGGSIHDKMLDGINEELALRILREIASALDHAHSKGYVHRDIKPENILFRDDNSAVLTDFGVARALLGGARHTHAGTVVGTPHYMSPEQTRGKTVDARSDLYSLGIVFFEMLTGSVPYQGEEPVTIALKHLASPIPTLPQAFMHLQSMLDKLLNKEPEKRYQRGNELVADLEALEMKMRNSEGIYMPSHQNVGRQLGSLLLIILRQTLYVIRTKLRQAFNVCRSLRFTRERGFYRAEIAQKNQTLLTQQHTLIATRLQRELTAQDLWRALKNGKKRYTLGTIAALAIAAVLFYMWLPEPPQTPVVAQKAPARAAINNTPTVSTETSKQTPVVADPTSEPEQRMSNLADTDAVVSTVKSDTDISNGSDSDVDNAPMAAPENPGDIVLTPATANNMPVDSHIEPVNDAAMETATTANADKDVIDSAINNVAVASEPESEPEPDTFALTVTASPPGARVRIMNIRERYQPGISLTPGRYHIEVTHPGYGKYLRWITLGDSNMIHKVTLEEVQAVGTVFSHPMNIGGNGPSLTVVPPGSFTMGGDSEDAQPRHTVRFSAPLAVTQHEITFNQYERFARAKDMPLPGDNRWGREDRPVINISWEEARMYAEWLSEQTAQSYRLPTEAEWEYIARAGGTGNYWWGNDAVGASGYANCRRHCDSTYTGLFRSRSAPVGSFEPSPYGVYDTAGNVAEWVADCYRDNYNNASASGHAYEEKNCEARVVRGGSMRDDADNVNVFLRRSQPQHTYHEDIGFRLVVDL